MGDTPAPTGLDTLLQPIDGTTFKMIQVPGHVMGPIKEAIKVKAFGVNRESTDILTGRPAAHCLPVHDGTSGVPPLMHSLPPGMQGVKVVHVPGAGRGVVAGRAYKVGDEVMSDIPLFVCGAAASSESPGCGWCHRVPQHLFAYKEPSTGDNDSFKGPNITLRDCSCKVIQYCSRDCKVAHWRAGHSVECKYLKSLGESLESTPLRSSHPVLRRPSFPLIAKIRAHGVEHCEFSPIHEGVAASKVCGVCASMLLCMRPWRDTPHDGFVLPYSDVLEVYRAGERREAGAVLGTAFPQTVRDLEYTLSSGDLNAFDTDVGTGLYPFLAMCNTECAPNTARVSGKSGKITAIATRPISAGEEVTITYWDGQTSPGCLRRMHRLDYGLPAACGKKCCLPVGDFAAPTTGAKKEAPGGHVALPLQDAALFAQTCRACNTPGASVPLWVPEVTGVDPRERPSFTQYCRDISATSSLFSCLECGATGEQTHSANQTRAAMDALRNFTDAESPGVVSRADLILVQKTFPATHHSFHCSKAFPISKGNKQDGLTLMEGVVTHMWYWRAVRSSRGRRGSSGPEDMWGDFGRKTWGGFLDSVAFFTHALTATATPTVGSPVHTITQMICDILRVEGADEEYGSSKDHLATRGLRYIRGVMKDAFPKLSTARGSVSPAAPIGLCPCLATALPPLPELWRLQGWNRMPEVAATPGGKKKTTAPATKKQKEVAKRKKKAEAAKRKIAAKKKK